jgi:hypothetical protein
MLKKTLNPEKLKVKYVLENHTSLKTYPDAEDILFEYIRDYCNRPKATYIKFTDVSLVKYYSLPEEKLREILTYLEEKGFIDKIHSTSAYSTYEVIKNPY